MTGASPSCPPALGPRIVFFTGGTALRDFSRHLTQHTHNSVHLITPFDSGGSTAVLRKAFAMPAVGDIRNRLLALADTALVPASVLDFCTRRLPEQADPALLRADLFGMAKDMHPAWAAMPRIFADPLRLHVSYFLEHMPASFDLRGACLGNLVLAGGYLQHKRSLLPVLAFFARLLQVRGMVQPTVDDSFHLAAELEDGSFFVGQHRFKHIASPVARICLSVHEPDRPDPGREPCRPPLALAAATHLRSAGAICYPMGSFYSSVAANLLPAGVGHSVATADCPKIFIPNSGTDVEEQGMDLADRVAVLLDLLHADDPQASNASLLHTVLVDGRNGRYAGGLGPRVRQRLADMGVTLVEREMIDPANPQRHVPQLAVQALLGLLAGMGR